MCLMCLSFAQPSSEDAGEKLLEACKAGNLDTVIYHVHSGVDVDFRNEVGKTIQICKDAQEKSAQLCTLGVSI